LPAAHFLGGPRNLIQPLPPFEPARVAQLVFSLAASRSKSLDYMTRPGGRFCDGIHSETHPIPQKWRRFNLPDHDRKQPLLGARPSVNERCPPLGFLPTRSSQIRTDENHNPGGGVNRAFQFVVQALARTQILKINPGRYAFTLESIR
jgi:hypothetical protein